MLSWWQEFKMSYDSFIMQVNMKMPDNKRSYNQNDTSLRITKTKRKREAHIQNVHTGRITYLPPLYAQSYSSLPKKTVRSDEILMIHSLFLKK